MNASIKKKESTLQRFSQEFNRKTSEKSLLLTRNLAFGAAAVCLVVLLQLLQVGLKDHSLEISAFASSIGMSIWLVIGTIYESFVILGKKSYPYFQLQGVSQAIGLLMAVAGISLVTAIAGVTWYLSEKVFWVFIVSVAVSFLLVLIVHKNFANWWYGNKVPGNGTSNGGRK